MERPGAHPWHCWGAQSTWGTEGQTGSTHVAPMDRRGAHMALMDREHTHGIDGQTESTCVALTGSLGAHMWH